MRTTWRHRQNLARFQMLGVIAGAGLLLTACVKGAVDWKPISAGLSLSPASATLTPGQQLAATLNGGVPPFTLTSTGISGWGSVQGNVISYLRPWQSGVSSLTVRDSLGAQASLSVTLAGGGIQLGGGPGGYVSPSRIFPDVSGNGWILVGNAQGLVPGATPLDSSEGDVFALKIGPTGGIDWATQIGAGLDSSGNPSWSEAKVVHMDGSGSIYVAGITTGSFAGENQYGVNSNRDVFLMKLNPGGTKAWVSRVGASAWIDVIGLTTDSTGNVYVSGNIDAQGSEIGTQLGVRGSNDVFVLKFLASGSLSWAREIGIGASTEVYLGYCIIWSAQCHQRRQSTESYGVWDPYGLHVDSSGNVVVIGAAANSAPAWGTMTGSHGDADLFSARINANGTLGWYRQIGGGGTSQVVPYNSLMDSTGSVGVIGHITNGGTIGGTHIGTHSDQDYYMVKWSNAGALQYRVEGGYGPGSTCAGYELYFDASGNTIYTGDGGNTGPGNYGFVGKLNSAGVPQWHNQYQTDTNGTILGNWLWVEPGTGNILVSGSASGSLGGNLVQQGGNDLFVRKVNPAGVLLWNTQIGGGVSQNVEHYLKPMTDSSGNIFILGRTTGSISGEAVKRKPVLIKVSPAGAFSWGVPLTQLGLANGVEQGLSVDSSGNTLVLGTTTGTLQMGATRYGGQGATDAFVVKVNSLGIVQ